MKKKRKNQNTKQRTYFEMINEASIQYPSNEKFVFPEISPLLKIDFKINIINKYEDNNLSFIKNIKKPDFKKIEAYNNALSKNEISLFKNIDNIIVSKTKLFIRNIYGDGNSYYSSLRYSLTNTQVYYNYFRNYIYNYLNDNKDIYRLEYPYINDKEEIIDFDTYIENINKNGKFAGELELLMKTKIFNIDILVLEFKNK